jgi:Family of unknown function (DUF5990)
MQVVIDGFELPGRTFCDAAGHPLTNVYVGVQIRAEPSDLVSGDAAGAHWTLDVTVVEQPSATFDFRGPAVHGRRGDRFLYLTWGNVDDTGRFKMFRRAKLMLDRIDPTLVATAHHEERPLVGTIRLTDQRGGPRCARVDAPDLTWTIG